MLLIPRFYYNVCDNYSYRIDKGRKNKKRFVYDESLKAQRFYVYHNDFYDGKFIKIEDKFYYRPDWDASKDWVYNNICIPYNVTNRDGHVMFQRPTRDMKNKYPYHQDLYYLFHTFEEFESWLKRDDVKLVWNVLRYKKFNIDAYRDMFISLINDHFKDNNENIFLLKVKFKSDERTL